MKELTEEQIQDVLIHWKEKTLEKNLRKLQVEILKHKLGGEGQGLVQHLQQNYDEMEKELNVLQEKNKKNVDGHSVQQLHKGES